MLQATVCNSGTLDVQAFCEDCLSAPGVDIGRSEVVEAPVIADVVIVCDEGVDLTLEITGQIVVVEQDAAPARRRAIRAPKPLNPSSQNCAVGAS